MSAVTGPCPTEPTASRSADPPTGDAVPSASGDAVPGASKEQAVLDRTRPAAEGIRAEAFADVVRHSGLTPTALALSFARLAFGAGSLAFADFVRLRLFDPEIRAAGDLERFVGQRRNRDLCVEANFRHDWFGLLGDKVASLSYLAAHGYPIIPIAAIYAPRLSGTAAHVLRERAGLADFLLDPANHPLFGKPVDGIQSLGSIGLAGCSPAARTVTRSDGTVLPVESVVDAIHAGYRDGYLVQPLVRPEAAIGALCGSRLATVRFVTIADERGPRVFRAAWKIPAGRNIADNYWRSGNLLGQIDPASGRVGRVVSGAGLSLREHVRHPDTDAALTGFVHPRWPEMCALAVEGARLMRHVPLIGWDIACTTDGPVIVEMNEAPDLFLVQLADRRGVLDPDFTAFLAEQRSRASTRRRAMRQSIQKL